jgi:MFS transporter, MHS family, shikimate and dehydroshikimate transport protein
MQAESRPAGRGSVFRAVGASTIGTIVEWYDFYIYGTAAALVLNKLFFPSLDPVAGILASYAAYAIGFLVRPIGGLVFGYFGDKYGRKPVLIATLMLMGFSTAAIGLLPTYNSIGIAAPILLIVLRMLQGLGAGAEYSGAVLFAAEYSGTRRGFWASWPPAAVDAAIVLSAGVFALFSMLPSEQFLAWGWRIPFLLSLVAVGIGYFVRRRILETPEFTKVEAKARTARMPVWELIRTQPRAVVVAMGANVIMNVGYVYQVYVLTYMTKQLGVSQATALTSLVIAATCGAVASIVFGTISDRVGRRKVMLFGSLFTAAYAFPFFWLLQTRNPVVISIAMTVGLVVGLRTVFGVQPAFYAELFPVRFRFSGIALARETTGAFIGGPLPLVATALVAAAGGAFWPVAVLMVIMALTTALAIVMAPKAATEPDAGDADIRIARTASL